jgi:predicted nuclease of predicted toxin-antitoxin system
MKILLDESLPRKLKYDFDKEHEVLSVRELGWLGKKNGELLRLITENSFELFVTVDKNLQYQQNLEPVAVTIVVLRAKDNRRETLSILIPKIFDLFQEGNIKKVIEVF